MEDTMEPKVDLAINSATGEHTIEVSFGPERFTLEPGEAASLAADLSTVLSFTMRRSQFAAVDTAPEPAKLAAVPDLAGEESEEVPAIGRIKWHRKGTGTGQYEANLGDAGKALVFPAEGSKGWDIRINRKKLNKDGPIMLARDAKALVERVVRENSLTV